MIEVVEVEVVNKTYGEIVEEVRRKLVYFRDRFFKRNDLVILMPEKDYNTVLDATSYVLDVDIRVTDPNLFGVKLKPCQVDKIYVAFDGLGEVEE